LAQKFDYPKSEYELQIILDRMYRIAKEQSDNGSRPTFKGLLEIISSETVIKTAIHNLMGNKGSRTPGSDGKVLRDILEKEYDKAMEMIKDCFHNYHPIPIRRKYIPKDGKPNQFRPLGIPAIIDRIVQECIRIVLEPILEAQFFKHSYGFRPMRDAHMALERINSLTHNTGYHWIIEGDISKFFDNVNHSILIRKLWHMGIRDKRVLMIIKAMLKASIMGEIKINSLGTPQGGILSPLLANAYLDSFDQWINREWEGKKTRQHYARHDGKIRALKRASNLKPAYLIRYADDWVLITNSKANAEKWKRKITLYLKTALKLELSEEKTLITNVSNNPIHFLGFTLKKVKGNSRTGYITRTRPNPDRLRKKMKEIHKAIHALRRSPTLEMLVHKINVVNSQIRGTIQYYQAATWVCIDLSKYGHTLRNSAFRALRRNLGEKMVKWTPANQVNNLPSVHQDYETTIPAFKYNDFLIGVTSIAFCNWKKTTAKNPEETPYTMKGRELYSRRTGKQPLLKRADELFDANLTAIIATGRNTRLYNLEYVINRMYAFNRDKGACRVCRQSIWEAWEVNTHHINPRLPTDRVNKVMNLATVHIGCHKMIHSNEDYSHLNSKTWKKILDFREKLKGRN